MLYTWILHRFFFSYESSSDSRLCMPFSYFRHLLPRSSSRKRFPPQRNPDSSGRGNCTLFPTTSKCHWLALKSVRSMIMKCDWYVVKLCKTWSINRANHWTNSSSSTEVSLTLSRPDSHSVRFRRRPSEAHSNYCEGNKGINGISISYLQWPLSSDCSPRRLNKPGKEVQSYGG